MIIEIKAVTTGLPPLIVIINWFKSKSSTFSHLDNQGKVAAMLGVVPNGLIGSIWMVGTPDLKEYRFFKKLSRMYLQF